MVAMQTEYDVIVKNDMWYLIDSPIGKKAIGTKWVYKLKHNPENSVDCYKSRLVVKSYVQEKALTLIRHLLPHVV